MHTEIKHIRSYLLITLFIFWLIVGYLIADSLIPVIFTTPPFSSNPSAKQPIPTPSSRVKQGNILIVITDDLSSAKPTLVSVWALFISLSDPPNLIIKSLYPSLDTGRQAPDLAHVIFLPSQGQLSPEFNDAIKYSGFEWDNFIVMDFIALQSFIEWLSADPFEKSLLLPSTPDQTIAILGEQKQILESICTHLVPANSVRGPKPGWQTIIPSHVQSDLSFMDTVVNWERLTLSIPATHCEVLVTP
jgi:hypothetical protein